MRSRKKRESYLVLWELKKKKREKKIASGINIFNPYSDHVEDTHKNLIPINPSCFLVADQQTNLGLFWILAIKCFHRNQGASYLLQVTEGPT